MRDGAMIWEGKIDALKRFKDDVKEVAEGFECGIAVDGFSDSPGRRRNQLLRRL